MDDQAQASPNPFDEIGSERQPDQADGAPQPANDNPFDAIGPDTESGSSATGAFVRGAARSALPAIGSLPAIGAGAEAGGVIGGMVGGPIGGLVGGVVGGVGGAIAGAKAISTAQDWALSKLPDSWREAIGMDDRQQKLDESQHKTAAFIGGMVPYALTMRPGAVARGALPENATALQRIMAHPVTARVFGGGLMGGMELGQEEAQGESPDWTKVAISTGFGMVFNKPTRIGETITEAGARPARRLMGVPEPVAPAIAPAPERPGVAPEAAPAQPAGPPVTARDWNETILGQKPATVAEAGDAKVVGPGVTEDVFMGTAEQHPTAAMTAQDARRTEETVTGTGQPEADLHAIARHLEPETFEKYDDLSQQRDTFRNWISEYNNPPQEDFDALAGQRADLEAKIAATPRGAGAGGAESRRLRAQLRDVQKQEETLTGRRDAFAAGTAQETPELAQARAHLQAVDYEMRDLAPHVAAAYRRAADYSGSPVVEPPAPEVGPEAPQAAPAPAPEAGQPSAAAAAAPPETGTQAAPPPTETAAPAVQRPIANQKAFIAGDVTQKLIAAGRPPEEARAAGALIAARYETRAARLGGKAGTAEELYRREGAEIQGPGGRAAPAMAEPAPTLAPSGEEETAAAPVQAATEAVEKVNTLTPAQQKRDLPTFTQATDASLPAVPKDHPAGVFMFNPTELNVDAERFQFKSGGDQYGVTGALRGVTKWDPAKAQSIIVWEQNDGTLFVADGHQRAGLARRLTEEGKVKGAQLPGVLYREKEGVSADDIRSIAAVTNIANGSGTALDGAKVLRARPDLMDGSLPLSVGKGKQAAALAKLGDESFRMVVNDVVPEHYAAVVGELLPNDPDRQVAAMKAIARFEPKNIEEATALTQRVAQAELAKAEEGKQTSMFGDLETAESTAGEEMKIVGRAIKDLQKDKALFSRVISNAERIETTGSRIERGAAQSVATDSEIFAKVLASDAYSAGPVRTALIAAAKDLRDGKATVGDAASQVHAALRQQVEENGLNRSRDLGREPEPAEAELFQSDLDWTPGGGSKTATLGDTTIDYGIAKDGKSGEIILVKTPVDKRGQGSARRALEAMTSAADAHGTTLFLNSDPMEKGISKPKLDAFYKSLGFVKNTGRNKDFTSRAEFVRQPDKSKELFQKDEPQFEPGAEGKPQQLIPGVAPLSQRDQIQAAANKPLRGGTKPLPAGSLFGDSMDQKELFQAHNPQVETPEFKNWFGDSKVVDEQGNPVVVYHGSKRTDRIADRGKFDRKRATSGPMAFFSDNPEMASSYATKKEDTSLPDETHLAERFLIKGKGQKKGRPVNQMWWSIPAEERRHIADLAPRVYENDEGQIVVGGPERKDGIGNYDYELKQAHGNHLQALAESWLHSGQIFDQEERFLEVLKKAGLETPVEYRDPLMEAGGVFPTYLSIKNPLDTSAIPQNVIDALQKSAKGKRAPKYSVGKDQWDKTIQDPKEWLNRLIEDQKDNTAYAWTSIPDWVTDTLRTFGYDGIKDIGGKMGGDAHHVWIPFDENQVKSAIGNRGTFNPDSPKLYDQAARGKIRIRQDARPVITLMKDANASTFIHETGHQWLEEVMRDAEHPHASDSLKDDAQTVRDWLGVNGADEIKTRHHEKFARGFEQYMREGVAPSPELAGVFSKFKNWLVSIYNSIKGLGPEINPDIRQVFDRLITMEPQRTVIAPERPGGPTLADIHEADAREIEPHEADAAMTRIAAETVRAETEIPPEVKGELETELARDAAAGAERAGAAGDGAGQPAEVAPGGIQPKPEPEGGAVREGPSAVVGSGSAAGREGASVSGGEQPVSRSDAGSPLAPSPSTLFGPAESPFADKAGNIRLDNLTSREDVAKAIRDAADANDDFIGDRRGVVTDGQVMELADALGMDFDQLMRRKVGDAFNAEQVVAARKLLIQSATDVSTAMKKAAVGTDDDVMAYAIAKDRHQMIQAQVAGITAEAGRALRAFRDIKGTTEVQAADQFIKAATGKTLFQLREEAKLGSSLDTPQQVSKFMNDAQRRTFGRMVLEYWINGLISGPSTHVTYMIGNTILALHKAGPETAAAALIGRAARALGREGDVVHIGEVGAQLRGAVAGIAPAIKASADAFRTGMTTMLPGEDMRKLPGLQPGQEFASAARMDEAATYRDAMTSAFSIVRGLRDGIISGGALLKAGGVEGAPLIGAQYSPLGSIPDIAIKGVNVLPVGSLVRAPGRFIAAIHSLFRSINYSMDKNARAYRAATEEGLSGTAFDARVADLRQNPTPEIMEGAREEATQLTLMGQGSNFTKALSKLTNTDILGFPLLKFIDPFVHISGNIIEQSLIQRTPFGLLAPELRADLAGKNGSLAQDKAAARMLVGTAMSITFGALAGEGMISGSEPPDPKAAATWRLAGNQAHSVRIGDIWYDVHRLGPLGMLMSIAADMYDVADKASNGDMLDAASHLQHAFTQNILDESFMRGPSDLIKAIEDPGRYGESYLRNFASSFVPYSVGMAQMARASDPYSRRARTVMDSIKAKVPGLSETLPARIDIWGNPIPSKETLGAPGVTAIYETSISHDPVNQALWNLSIYPAAVSKKIRNVELTDSQYLEYAQISGRMTKARLDAIVRSPDFATWPNNIRHDVISETIRQTREVARGLMMGKHREIIQQATALKLAKMRGEKTK